MKTSFRTLAFIFFVPLIFLVYPLHSQADEESSAQAKDIQIIDNPYEFGDYYDENKADEYKIIKLAPSGRTF